MKAKDERQEIQITLGIHAENKKQDDLLQSLKICSGEIMDPDDELELYIKIQRWEKTKHQ